MIHFRAFRALRTRMNHFSVDDFGDLSNSSESRLIKYHLRGFGTLLHKQEIITLVQPLTEGFDVFRAIHTPKSLARSSMIRLAATNSTKSKTSSPFDSDNRPVDDSKKTGAAYDETYIPFGEGTHEKKFGYLVRERQITSNAFLVQNGPTTKFWSTWRTSWMNRLIKPCKVERSRSHLNTHHSTFAPEIWTMSCTCLTTPINSQARSSGFGAGIIYKRQCYQKV